MEMIPFHSTMFVENLSGPDFDYLMDAEISKIAVNYLKVNHNHIWNVVVTTLLTRLIKLSKQKSDLIEDIRRINIYLNIMPQYLQVLTVENHYHLIDADVVLEAALTPFYEGKLNVHTHYIKFIQTSPVAHLNEHFSQLLIPLLKSLSNFNNVNSAIATEIELHVESFLVRYHTYSTIRAGFNICAENMHRLIKLFVYLIHPRISDDCYERFERHHIHQKVVNYFKLHWKKLRLYDL